MRAGLVLLVALTAGLAGGCRFNGGPRPRLGVYPASNSRGRFNEVSDLGNHSYKWSPFEGNGIIGTCRGGHIDIAHLRIAADHTRWLSEKAYESLMDNEEQFHFWMRVEPSRYYTTFTYPDGWETMDPARKEAIAREVSIATGQYLAYTAVSWHEMLVWFGFRSVGFLPEFNSAFSWEDNYSNLLGTHLAVQALKDTEHSFDDAMTILLEKELQDLEPLTVDETMEATEKMRGEWFTGRVFVDVTRRNLDLGLDDGYVNPTVNPTLCPKGEAKPCPVPSLAALAKHGFGIAVEIEPREWQKKRVLRIVYPNGEGDRINPMIHFEPILEYVAKQAVEKYGYTYDS